jgi:spore maturation protein CgeB
MCPFLKGRFLEVRLHFKWEFAELFCLGDGILCYRDLYDLCEVWSFYIKRPERCREIGHAGQQRAVREHTWEQRFRTVSVLALPRAPSV